MIINAVLFLQLEAGPVDEEEYQQYRATTDLREPYRYPLTVRPKAVLKTYSNWRKAKTKRF